MGTFPRDVWLSLSGSEFRAAEEISYRTRGQDWALLPREFLAKRLGISISQVSRVTSSLQEKGILQKFQRIYRRKDGTFDVYPCLYRLVPWAKWKFQQIMGVFTRVRQPARTHTKSEKITPLDLSFVKNEGRRIELERFGRLGQKK